MRHPEIDVILHLASKGGPQGTLALNYFLDNCGRRYSRFIYDSSRYSGAREIAFVPAIHKGERKLFGPWKVFSNPDWQLFGLPILDPSLRRDAVSKLGIKEHPLSWELVALLTESPPATELQACEWFKILSRRIQGLCNDSCDKYMY